ncbi:MAG TPA: kelch repeat-containing protein [Bryobacteraceae bacterium]|nr:kelch repeat-containing protein [Bryobacteraceae bacterium]
MIRIGRLRGPSIQLSLLAALSLATQASTPPVTVSPANLNFAKLPVGETSPPQQVTLTNNQSVTLKLASITVSANYLITNNTCGTSIAALASCTLRVEFMPQHTGTLTGTVTFNDNASNSPQTVSLKGTGGAAALLSIAVTPASSSAWVGDTVQYTATGTYSNHTTQDLTSTATWSATPPGVASVTTSGLATALAAGVATITATDGSITGTASLAVAQTFSPIGSLNTARYYHTATLLNGGYVLVAAGIGPNADGGLGELSSAEVYTPGTTAFTYTGSLNVARDEHTATLLNSGAVLIAGGNGGDGELASAELYNPSTGTFSLTGNLNSARYTHSAAILPNGMVLIAGGYGGGAPLSSAELYNPATGTFSYTGSLNAARYGATATVLPNGTVLIAGGSGSSGALSSVEIYSPASGTFALTGSLNVARSEATATLLNTGSVLIADGYNYSYGPLTSAELYNPSTGTFALTGSLSASCWLGTATLLTDGAVLVAGSAFNAASAETYSPSSGKFAVTGNLITPRYLQTATMLPSGDVLMVGGINDVNGAVLSTAELYPPSTLAIPNLVSITISPASPSLTVGGSQQLQAIGTFVNNSTQTLASVIWTSSNPAVATVTNDETNSGVVYGMANGTAMISACTGAVCGTTPVNVSGSAGRRQ